jgi:hypothetical protein
MQERPDQKRTGILMLGAGVVAIVSAMLDWYELTDEAGSETFKGSESTGGLAAIGFGIGLVILGTILLRRGARTGGKGSSITAIVFSLFILFVSGYSVASPGDAVASFEKSDISEAYGISEDQAEAAVKAAIADGDLEVKAEAGAMLGIVPGLLGTLAGILGIVQARKIRGHARGDSAAADATG